MLETVVLLNIFFAICVTLFSIFFMSKRFKKNNIYSKYKYFLLIIFFIITSYKFEHILAE